MQYIMVGADGVFIVSTTSHDRKDGETSAFL